MASGKYIVGISGGIGSGKTTVGKMLEELGAYVIDADTVARELTSKDSPVLEAIVKAFGDVLTSTGELDRAKVASIVFKSSDKMKKLESILHPEIQKEYRRRASESGEKIIFLVIPLLFEKEIEDTVNEIWLCYAPLETRLERVKKRDRTSMNDILARVDMQIPDELKLEKVDLVIDTSGSLDEIRGQVSGAYEILKSGMSE